MFSEATRFLKICVSKIFFKNFQALVNWKEVILLKYSSELLYNRNVPMFVIFLKMYSSTQKQSSTDAL